MTLRTLTFKNVLTEYTSIGKLDESHYNGRTSFSAVTNIMLHPEKDAEMFNTLLKIYAAYSGKTEDAIKSSSRYMKFIENEGNDFDGYYKIKVRRSFFENTNKTTGKKYKSCGNIKGVFSQSVIDKSKSVNKDGKLVPVNPNYNLFVHDASKDGVECFTGRLWAFPDGNVNRADVQVVVEDRGEKGVILTLFKYRVLEYTDMNSSTYKEVVEAVPDRIDGLDNLFDCEDTFDISDDELNRGEVPEFDDEDDDIIF